MKKLEQYIIEMSKIERDIEYQFLIFRVIKSAADIAGYLEDTAIRRADVFHPILEDYIEKMYSDTLLVAMKYVSNEIYTEEIYNITFFDSKKIDTIELPTVLTITNTIIHTSSEIANTMTDPVENEYLVSSLVLDLIKHIYRFCEILGVSIEQLREDIYDYKEELLLSTSDLMKKYDEIEDADKYHLDVVLNKGKYKAINVFSGKIKTARYASGNIVTDFFNCTKDMRERNQVYEYTNKLFDYFMSEQTLDQAYICNGKFIDKNSIDPKELDYYKEHHDEFERKFHHILINSSISNMDDLLDFVYSK